MSFLLDVVGRKGLIELLIRFPKGATDHNLTTLISVFAPVVKL